ncbi:MAG: hypothetical protein HY649_11205 [Acidobacteria bacterium]|nr:hypothetical protein [Acidobacteriota bacterium]
MSEKKGIVTTASILCLVWLLFPKAASGQMQPIPEGLVNGQAARFVLGQRNFSDITGGTSEIRIGATSAIAITGNKLIVSDSSFLSPPNNNRILIYNDLQALKARLPQDELPPADVVLGQPDFTTAAAGTAADRMNQPVGVATDGTRLYVAEWGNNRVLIYHQIPQTSGFPANVVIGQQDFASASFAAGPRGLRRPSGVSTDGTRLFVADTLNNRVLIFNRIPTENGAAADVVLGQPNFDGFNAMPAAANTLHNPTGITTDGQRLIVTDLGNNRVLIFNRIPTESGAAADIVVGQADFTSNTPGNTEAKLNFPRFAYSDGTRLLIADSGNNRIMIYNRIPTQNGATADLVLGQEDFLGIMESCAASNFAVPYSVASDGETLYVSDSLNRRVLGFRPGTPLVNRNGVVNTASFSSDPQTAACSVFLPQPPVAPGAIASIFGSNLAETTAEAASSPLPRELGGVRVRFNGIEAPIFSVSPTQINVQVPFELTGFSASLEIEKQTPAGKVISAAIPAGLANGAPGIFTQDGTGKGKGVIVHADFTPVSADSPALPGETLTAFVTGLGSVDHPTVSGDAAQFGAMGGVQIGGSAVAGQSVTITINNNSYSYTTVSGDALDTVAVKLAELIDRNDPNVSATVDVVDFAVKLRARVFGDEGTNITYSASTPVGSTLTAGVNNSNLVPGSIALEGTPVPGQTLTVFLSESPIPYTAVPGDTAGTVVMKLANLISDDPNVVATADPANGIIHLELRDPSLGQTITYTASVDSVEKLAAFVEGTTTVPGSVRIVGSATAGQTVSVSLAGIPYAYTTVPDDTPETIIQKLAGLINDDSIVSATVDNSDPDNPKLSLQLRNPDSGLTIPFSVSVFAVPSFRVTPAYEHLVPGIANVSNTVSAAIGKGLPLVPGDIFFGGTAAPGQTVTINLLETPYSYTNSDGDTLQTVVSRLAELISGDPNVSATADLTSLTVRLQLRSTGQDQRITFSSSVSPGATLLVLTQSLQSTDAISVPVAFAGLVKGSVGLYQVNFTLPDTIQPNPSETLTLSQNLVVLGSATSFDIFSNSVDFPIGKPPSSGE